jgi:small basic protein
VKNNGKPFEVNGELLIDTFPEIPNSIKEVKDGVELTFGACDEEPAFDFETGKDENPSEAGGTNVSFEVVNEEKTEEFVIPEKFGGKPEKPQNDEPKEQIHTIDQRVRTTYVPRFTEASERFRLGRYRPELDIKREKDAEDPEIAGIDPTAEIEETLISQEELDLPKLELEPRKSTAKMFKFFQNEPKREEEPQELVTEDEPFDLEEFSVDEPKSSPPEMTAEEITEQKEEIAVEENTAAEEEIFKAKTIEYEQNIRKYEEAPWDIGDKIENGSKGEYTVFSQRESFIEKILDSIMSVKIRFFTSIALAFILLVLENLFLFGLDIPQGIGMSSQKGAMAILDLMFAACLYLLALPEVICSVKALISRKITPELYLSALLLVNIIYTLVCSFNAVGKYPLLGVIFSLASIMAIGASYFKKSAEHSCFTLVSQNGEKRVMDIKATRELDRENIALDGIVKEHVSKTVRFFRTSFVSGFFKRSSKVSENSQNVLITLVMALCVGLFGGLTAYFVPGGIVAAFATFGLSFSLAIPAFSLLSHKLPYLAITEELKAEKTAIIGEKSVLDYAGADVVAFEDTEVFGPDDVNLQRIMLYGKNENLSKALKQMSALFQKVGGPLDVLFSNSLDRKCPPACNTFVEEDGVSGEIDFNSVAAGTLDYMLRHRIQVPEEEVKDGARTSLTTRVIYAAENGEVFAKFLIRYSFSEEFSMILPVLMEEGVTPLIYTRDPNVNSDFIKTLTAGNDKIRVIKRRTAPVDDNTVYRRVNAGGVVLGDKTNAITSLLLCKKYAEMSEKISLYELIISGGGAILGALLSIFSLGTIPSLIFALGELGLALGLFFYTKKKIYVSPFDGESKK